MYCKRSRKYSNSCTNAVRNSVRNSQQRVKVRSKGTTDLLHYEEQWFRHSYKLVLTLNQSKFGHNFAAEDRLKDYQPSQPATPEKCNFGIYTHTLIDMSQDNDRHWRGHVRLQDKLIIIYNWRLCSRKAAVQQNQQTVTCEKTHPSSPRSFNTGHDVADVITEELDDGGIIGHLKHVKHDVLQRRPTLLIGQTTLVVVIETIRYVQWRLPLVEA